MCGQSLDLGAGVLTDTCTVRVPDGAGQPRGCSPASGAGLPADISVGALLVIRLI